MTHVIFKREHKDGLQLSQIDVAGEFLHFVNDVAVKPLAEGETFVIHWRIFGDTGSSLVVTKRHIDQDEGDAEEIVNSTIEAKDKGRVSDAVLFDA